MEDMGRFYKYSNLEKSNFYEYDRSDILSGPLHVAVDITNKCNAHCLHCFNRSGDELPRLELSDESLLDVFNQIAEIKPFSTCFCGGEPMMRYKILLDASRMLKNAGVPNIAMVTNGWFMTKERAIQLRDSGVTHVQLSLDGKDAETHDRMRGLKGIFDKVMDAVKFIDEVGISSAIAFSPTQFNIRQFPEVVELLRPFRNIREIRVQPLMPLGKAIGGDKELFATEEEYRELVKYLGAFNEKCKANGFKLNWSDPLDHLRRFVSLNFKNNIFTEVKADGSLCASAYIPVTVGNVKRHSLREYWEAGLGKIWDIPVIRELAEYVVSIEDMRYDSQELPQIFYEDNVEFDLVEDSVMTHVKDFTLKKLYK